MQKTTAKVEHHDSITSRRIGATFCKVRFYGFRALEMKAKWDGIRAERYDKYNFLYEENEGKIQNLKSQADIIYRRVKESKPFYRFWYNKAEKKLLSDARELSNQAYKLEVENEKIGSLRVFGVSECHTKIECLLRDNGFVLIHTSSRGEECVTETEIWTLEE